MPFRKTNSIFLALGLAAACAMLFPKLYRKLKFGGKEENTSLQMDLCDEKAIAALSSPFQEAAHLARSLRNLNQNDQLMLYGLYKQGKEGNATKQKEPSKLNIVAWKKFTAWHKFYNMPRHFAMMKYIEVVEHLSALEQSRDRNCAGDHVEFCEGGGSEAVLEMMNDSDIDYGDDSSVDISESSNSHASDGHDSDLTFGVKQSTLQFDVGDDYEE
jgi:acyl-CoA-binding protein